MANLRLACTGARVGTLFIPAFQLRLGDLVCLHLPHPLPDEAEDDLLRVLTGKQLSVGFRLLGRVLAAVQACDDRPPILRLLRPLRVTRWLRQRTGMSHQEANEVLRRIGLDQDWPLTHLAGNPKTLLGLEAAWACGAEAILFATYGMDYSGRQAAHGAVASRLASCPAIHLSRVFFQNGQLLRDCFTGATCIEVSHSSALPLPAESA